MSRAMRDSGIPWIGKIPEHWEVVYGKKVYLVNDGGVWGADADGIDDTIVLRSTEQDIDGHLVISEPAKRNLSRKEFEAAKLMDGDLIITKSSGSPSHIGKTSLISKSIAELNCCFSNFIQRLRVNGYPLFYWFLLNSVVVKKQFEYLSTTTTGINNINSKTLDNLLFPTPSLAEQKAIADFLDKKCAEIDSLVAVQEQMLEELRAYKQSLITETVTHGLNPSAPMRDSGIPWIGKIPEHWETHPFKAYYKTIKGLNITKENLVKNGAPVISYGQIHSKLNSGVRVDEALIRFVSDEYLTCNPECLSKQHDLFFADTSEDREGAGNIVYIDTDTPIFAGYHTIIARPFEQVKSKYFAYLIQTDAWKCQLRSRVSGVKVFSISQKFINQTFIVIPPNAEQKAIADFLDEKCAEIDELIATKQQKIETLKEYKKSIIYEYVTGKKEVADE